VILVLFCYVEGISLYPPYLLHLLLLRISFLLDGSGLLDPFSPKRHLIYLSSFVIGTLPSYIVFDNIVILLIEVSESMTMVVFYINNGDMAFEGVGYELVGESQYTFLFGDVMLLIFS